MTAEFLSRLDARHEPDETWTLLAELRYRSAITERTYLVPAGFNTDLASVPRIPFAYWLTGNTATEAAVLHDWLYRTGAEQRKVCDAIFREAMAVTGVPAWRRWLMWIGVRVGGAASHRDTGDAVPADEQAK